jgi:hypothetical protein
MYQGLISELREILDATGPLIFEVTNVAINKTR